MTETTSASPQAGQIWTHVTDEYEIQTTRVTSQHVHYDIVGTESEEQAAAVRAFVQEEFDHSLVYVAPIAGSCHDVKTFGDVFEYVRERERAPYETE